MRYVAICLAFLISISSVAAGTMPLMGLGGTTAAGNPITITPCATNTGTFSAGTVSFLAQSICASSSDRIIVIAVQGRSTTAVSAITENLNAMTIGPSVVSAGSVGNVSIWYRADSSANTTANIVLTQPASTSTVGIAIYALTNGGTGGIVIGNTNTNTSTASSTTIAAAVTNAANGGTIASAVTNSNTFVSWTNATASNPSTAFMSGYDFVTSAGSRTYTATINTSSTQRSIAVANFH